MPPRSIFRHNLPAVVCLGFCLLSAAPLFGRPPVEMILLADPTPTVQMSARRWVETFSALGVTGVQIRAPQPGDKVGIEARGTEKSPSYRVIGQLSGANELILPGGRFAPTDRARLAKWLEELGTNGAAGVTETKGAFGLLAKQLGAVRDDLAQPVGFATKGVAAADAVAKIGQTLKLSMTIEPDAQQSLSNDEAVRDELDGLSCGTALAAILWPAGAVLRPRQAAGGKLEYVVAKRAGRAPNRGRSAGRPNSRTAKSFPRCSNRTTSRSATSRSPTRPARSERCSRRRCSGITTRSSRIGST